MTTDYRGRSLAWLEAEEQRISNELELLRVYIGIKRKVEHARANDHFARVLDAESVLYDDDNTEEIGCK